jgi:hypothetical protein
LQAAVTDPEIPVCHLLCRPVAWFEKLRVFDMNLAEMNEQYLNIPKRNTSSYFQALMLIQKNFCSWKIFSV